MSSSPETPRRISPEDTLPPVEPPSATFIIQLFVVPAAIVAIIVLVWTLFNWLAQMGNDPMSFVRALERNNEARWQAAVNLADALRNSRDDNPDSLKNNADLNRRLAVVLDSELTAGSMQENPVSLRMFLCRALGEFHVNDGLPVLLKAAETNRDPAERDVRLAALEGIALLSQHAPPLDAELQQRRQQVLLAASRDSDNQVRSAAAYALGVLGGDDLIARLHVLLDDPYADARFNAANGLARHGDPACVEVLCEMLNPDETAGWKFEQEKAQDYKRAMIIVNALRAARQFVAHHPESDRQVLAALREAATRLEQSPYGKSMRTDQIGVELTQLLIELRPPGTP